MNVGRKKKMNIIDPVCYLKISREFIFVKSRSYFFHASNKSLWNRTSNNYSVSHIFIYIIYCMYIYNMMYMCIYSVCILKKAPESCNLSCFSVGFSVYANHMSGSYFSQCYYQKYHLLELQTAVVSVMAGFKKCSLPEPTVQSSISMQRQQQKVSVNRGEWLVLH